LKYITAFGVILERWEMGHGGSIQYLRRTGERGIIKMMLQVSFPLGGSLLRINCDKICVVNLKACKLNDGL
jgi:hypothetical protein